MESFINDCVCFNLSSIVPLTYTLWLHGMRIKEMKATQQTNSLKNIDEGMCDKILQQYKK